MQKSPLIPFDPRAKFLALFFLAVFVMSAQTFAGISLAGIVATASLWMSPMSFRDAMKRLRGIVWFVSVIVAVQTFAASGRVMFEIGGMFATHEGLKSGAFLAAKIVLLSLFSIIFLSITRIDEMLDGIETVLAPFNNSGALFLVLSITLNFIPLFIRSAQQIKTAQISRGADVDSSPLKQLHFASSAALPLFVSAFRSSHTLADAIDARGFNPRASRTPFHKLRLTPKDCFLLATVAIVCASTLYLETSLN